MAALSRYWFFYFEGNGYIWQIVDFLSKADNYCDKYRFPVYQAPSKKRSTLNPKNLRHKKKIISVYSRPLFTKIKKNIYYRVASLIGVSIFLQSHLQILFEAVLFSFQSSGVQLDDIYGSIDLSYTKNNVFMMLGVYRNV